MAGYIFALSFGLLLNPQIRKAMEKIILLGIALWLNFGLADGFPPEKPVMKPFKPHVEFSDHRHPYLKADKSVIETNKPGSNKITFIVKSMDPH
jgi:hypothetical protein